MLTLEPNKYYHIYNRGNNREKLFYKEANYEYFLSRYQHHCSHIFDMYAFCLMNNHFHFLVSVKPLKTQESLFGEKVMPSKVLRSPSKHLSNFFNSYTFSINKQENRTGSLFEKPFKRKEIESEEYFRKLVIYIHQNPAKHGFDSDFKKYPYSSFPHYMNTDESFLNREKTLNLFGGRNNFLQSHNETSPLSKKPDFD